MESLDKIKNFFNKLKNKQGKDRRKYIGLIFLSFILILFNDSIKNFMNSYQEKKFGDFLEDNKDKLKKSENDLIGLKIAWEQRNPEAIEAYLNAKKENPEQYIEELDPDFFKSKLLKQSGKNIPFLKKYQKFLNPNEICLNTDKISLEKVEKNFIDIDNAIDFYTNFNYANFNNEEKDFLLMNCTEYSSHFEKFKNSLLQKNKEYQEKLDIFKSKILEDLSFLNAPYSSKDIIDKYFLGRCNPSYSITFAYTGNQALSCDLELEEYFGVDENLYRKVKEIHNSYKDNDEFKTTSLRARHFQQFLSKLDENNDNP